MNLIIKDMKAQTHGEVEREKDIKNICNFDFFFIFALVMFKC